MSATSPPTAVAAGRARAALLLRARPRRLSVLVPLAGRDEVAPRLPESLGLEGELELVVAADSELSDSERERLERAGARVSRSLAPRGARLRQAAAGASGEMLVFLHADTRLGEGWRRSLGAAIGRSRPWGAFRLGFAGGPRILGLVALGANLRSRFFGLPFGDQAPFVTRSAYEAVGGHPPWGLCEDVELALRLRGLAAPRILRPRLRTSARRYTTLGVGRSVARNARILALLRAGAAPEVLEGLYRRRP